MNNNFDGSDGKVQQYLQVMMETRLIIVIQYLYMTVAVIIYNFIWSIGRLHQQAMIN